MKQKLPDWFIRAVKTFVQAFFGVLAPEVAAVLRRGWPESWNALWGYLAPVIAAALAAAISAVWNILLERMRAVEPSSVGCADSFRQRKATEVPDELDR